MHFSVSLLLFFFFNDTATTEIYTLSLHDALPISSPPRGSPAPSAGRSCRHTRPASPCRRSPPRRAGGDRKSTRLNSSHMSISYAVFCLKKKNNQVREDGKHVHCIDMSSSLAREHS